MRIDSPIRIHLEQESDYAFRVRFDDTALASLLTDEPAPLGHDQGPNPSRLLLTENRTFEAHGAGSVAPRRTAGEPR